MGVAWVFSVARLPDAELQTVMRAHTPRTGEARRRKSAHETASGHSIHLLGWHGLLEI
jgi:hypothetical protein